MEATPIAFLGMGQMGRALAGLLLDDGTPLTVWNRDPAKVSALASRGAQVAATPAAAGAAAPVVFTMLGGDPSVESVVLGADGQTSGLLAGLAPGGIHVGLSTISPQLAERLTAAHAAAGSIYLACPVFGRPEAAAARQLWLVAGGPQAAFQRLEPQLGRLGRGLTYLGDSAAQAHLLKVAGNFLIAAAMEALAESFALVERGGLAPTLFLETVNQAVFRSPLYAAYGGRMASGTHEPAAFALHWGLKDVNLVRAAAAHLATPLPLGELLHTHLRAALERGWQERDWTAFGEIVREAAGLPARPLLGEDTPARPTGAPLPLPR